MSHTNSPANFAYCTVANDPAGLPLALSVFADRNHVRDQLCDDAEAAGFRIAEASDVTALLDGAVRPLGEVVLLDCPVVSATQLAALSRLDLRAANCGAQLIVSTSVAALEDVFACLDRSNPQLLIDPTRADRVIALGRALARTSSLRLRELSEEDRLVLLRLTEQVGQIAQRLEQLEAPLSQAKPTDDQGLRFESPRSAFAGIDGDGSERPLRATRQPLPDPRLVRTIIRQRQLRARFFEGGLFADPAWDILLDLTAAQAEHRRVSVTSLCIAANVPPTTALRWIAQMTDAGLLVRVQDEMDRRRTFIALSDQAADGMAGYFAELRAQGAATI